MSRNISHSKNEYENYLTLTNNCQVVSKSGKPKPHLNPENILTDNIRQVWVTYELPAVCILDLRNLIQKPLCWHQYGSNPKLIQIQYTGQDNPDSSVWVVLSKIRLELISGWQHFKIQTLPMKNLSFLKVKIMQNHSQFRNKLNDSDDVDLHDNGNTSNNFQYDDDLMTYLNQISLGYVEQIIQSRVQLTSVNNIPINNQREKTFSDFRKTTTSNDKEMRRLYEKVKALQNQGETMRRTIDKQNGLILKLQNVVNLLVENVDKMQHMQTIQQQKILKLLKQREKTKSKQIKCFNNKQQQQHYTVMQNHKLKMQTLFNDQSEIINQQSKPERTDNSLWEHKKQTTQSGKRKSQYEQQKSHSSKHDSSYKTKVKTSSNQKRPVHSNKRVVNANIDQSEDSLSEYQGVEVERIEQRQKPSRTRSQMQKKLLTVKNNQKSYIPMLQKLQELILLRDQKKNRLRTGKKSSYNNYNLRHRKQNVVCVDDSSDEQDQKGQYDNYDHNNYDE